MAGLRVHLYRYRHPDGAEKDWAYPVVLAPNAFTAFYGRTGAALRQADTPAIRCRGGNPAAEATARVQEKRAKGYRDLGEFWLAADRRQLTPAAPVRAPAAPAPPPAPQPAAEPPPPCWYWRWTPGPPAEADADGPGLWARVSGNAQNGQLTLADGHQPLVAFWLLVARRCPADLRLVDDAQRPVRGWPAALPVASALLETLGLQPRDLGPLLAACGGDADWFF